MTDDAARQIAWGRDYIRRAYGDEDASRAFDAAAHPRAPAGSATGGQFAAGQGAQQQPAKQPAGKKEAGKQPAGRKPKPDAHEQHVAHLRHLAHLVHLAAAKLRQGSSGPEVRRLQEMLNELGAKPPLKADGKFGPKTQAALNAVHGPKMPAAHPAKTAPRHAPARPAAKVPAAKVTRALAHEPLGRPGGPGLFHRKGEQLPAFVQHIARDLMESRGMPESEAIATAIAQCKRWAAGGPDVKPETRAKAAAAIAEWERLKASTHARRTTTVSEYDADGLDSSWDDLDDLPDLTGLTVADFEDAAGGPGSETITSRAAKLGSGARFKALKAKLAAKGAHDPGALAAYIGRKRYGKAKFAGLAAKARKGKGGGSMHRAELFRSYPLEDYHIVRTGEGDSSGRVVEAYMTVFDEPAEIRDHQGHYREDIDRSAFNKRIADLERSRTGFAGAKVFYNHGMTIHGTPSDRYSMPTAVCEGIRIDTRGPITRSRYLDTPLGNEVLEMWRSGAVTAQSFTGAIIRSSPELRRGEKYVPRNGQLPRVRRLELGLKEYGPTPFPAYQGAELVGVRMSPLGTWQDGDEELDETDEPGRLELDDDVALPPDEEAAAGGPPEVHPTREHAHRLFALRTEQAFRDAGIGPLKGGW